MLLSPDKDGEKGEDADLPWFGLLSPFQVRMNIREKKKVSNKKELVGLALQRSTEIGIGSLLSGLWYYEVDGRSIKGNIN